MTEYELIRSRRKSLAIQVKSDGGVIVRAPLRLAKYRIERFITEHEDWIRMQQKKVEKYREQIHIITEEERQNVYYGRKFFRSVRHILRSVWELRINVLRSGSRRPGGEAAVRPEI